VLRWYNHIKSFTDKERTQFPNKKAEFSVSAASAAKPADDDDDVDLFGSDDEDVLIAFLFNIIIIDLPT
jgi:elongation factor 1-beta